MDIDNMHIKGDNLTIKHFKKPSYDIYDEEINKKLLEEFDNAGRKGDKKDV